MREAVALLVVRVFGCSLVIALASDARVSVNTVARENAGSSVP